MLAEKDEVEECDQKTLKFAHKMIQESVKKEKICQEKYIYARGVLHLD